MRGIVMGIQNGSCVVLKDDGTFADLPDRGYQIGQKITIQIKSLPFYTMRRWRRVCFWCACLASACIYTAWGHFKNPCGLFSAGI